MKSSITWLDRLRSRLTEHPASLYANRRLAREDLHALEAQRAHAVRRLTEDIELLNATSTRSNATWMAIGS